jgi:gamma-glutamylcyclotransferase (GGCT)/AIG2-like uncharacterized protein YtfP
MLHFAYGSTLSSKYLRRHCPDAGFLVRAVLPNFRIIFPVYSEEMKGGIASIILDPGKLVRGVLYEIPEDEMETLDEAEGVEGGLYTRQLFLVLGEDRRLHRAALYRAVEERGLYILSRRYVELMLEGAEEHRLDPGYVERLRRLLRSLR